VIDGHDDSVDSLSASASFSKTHSCGAAGIDRAFFLVVANGHIDAVGFLFILVDCCTDGHTDTVGRSFVVH
jgi:hypothetical protein